MGFYSGRPGKSFEIARLFDSVENMHKNVATDNVQIGDFVIISDEKSADNGKIFIKKFDGNIYKYSQVGNIGGVMPHITKDGFWSFDTNNENAENYYRAVAREIKLEIETDRQINPLSFLYRNTDIVDAEGNIIETAPLYGLSDLTQKYVYTEKAGWQLSPEGEYVVIYRATENGEFIYENLERATYSEKDGYCFLDTDIWQIHHTTQPVFKTDWLKWKYIGEEEWHDLFEITGLVNIEFYAQQASMAMSSAEESYRKTEALVNEVEVIKEDYDKFVDALQLEVKKAEASAYDSCVAAQYVSSALAEFREDIKTHPEVNPSLSTLESEIADARAPFESLGQKLDMMPYQFDSILEMQASDNLRRGDKVFTFGRDNIGDGDSSKLFQIFDEVEDKDRLEEIIEGSQTEENPEGEKKIAEQYPLDKTKGLVAGLLTIFSGYGSGGGGGAGVPTISVTGSGETISVNEGETITLEYFWTGPTAGKATLYIKDSKDSKVIDYYDNNKVYSSGVTLNGFGTGTVTLQPSKGEHNYTFYVVDRAQAYSNEVKVNVVAGSLSLTVNYPDGKNFAATEAIIYTYSVNTIYAKKSILNYSVYQNGVLLFSGEEKSLSENIGLQSIRLNIKNATQSIGTGSFRISAYAYVEGKPEAKTNIITRNFVIMEEGTIYLTSSLTGQNNIGYQEEPFSIPLNLIFSGGSNFIVEGRYSDNENFNWEDGIPTSPSQINVSRAGEFPYPIIFTEVGTYYVKFKASTDLSNAVGYSAEAIKINIEEKLSKYPLSAETSLIAHYSARKGQTNGGNKNYWENISIVSDDYTADLRGFNYASNGWDTKFENGMEVPSGYLHCSSKAYAYFNYPLFSRLSRTQGATLEVVFKAADIGTNSVIFSSTYAPGEGIVIYKDKIEVNISNCTLTGYYNINGVREDSSSCHISVVVDPVGGYIKIFSNGVLIRASSKYSFREIPNTTISYLNRGRAGTEEEYGVVKCDAVRFYDIALTDTEILRNYVYNIRNEIVQTSLWEKNYLDSNTADQLPEKIPYMIFSLTKDDWARMDKDNYKPKIYVDYHDPNPPEGNESDYHWEKVQCAWQGTSSIAYPVKNFKIKLPEKYKLKGDKYSLKEKTFCLKADYMDSSHCHNTGTANFIHQTGLLSNYSLTPAQSKELNISVAQGYKGLKNLPENDLDGNKIDSNIQPIDLKTRTCIDGHPIALYVQLESEETENIKDLPFEDRKYEPIIFWGIYNFNLDKGSTDSFGLRRDTDDFQNVTSFEIAANTAFSGGGFRAMRFIKKIDAEEYGWTVWNVPYSIDGYNNYIVDLKLGQYLHIIKANAQGQVIVERKTVNFIDNEKEYIGVYNNRLEKIKGAFVENERYNENGELNSAGNFIALYQLNANLTGLLYKEQVDGTLSPVFLGYYDYSSSGWEFEVPYDSEVYDQKQNWEINGDYGIGTLNNLPANAIPIKILDNDNYQYVIIKDPVDISYKYEYYSKDFELRYPDEDIFVMYNGEKNKLFYKEYDKIISIVEWTDYIGIDKKDHFINEFKEHFDQDTLFNYYLTVMTTGLMDNFGKNLMIDTWGYNKNGEIPYELFEDENGNIYHKVWKFISQWDEDEEYYLDNGAYQYGLMDISNPIESEDGSKTYNVYSTDEAYSFKGDLLEIAEFGGTTDDRITGWYHEIDISQIVWYTHFYDLDSSLGLNNSGAVTFAPSIEMNDSSYVDYNNTRIFKNPFNTADSCLWQQLTNYFYNNLKSRFVELQGLRIYDVNTFKKYYYNDIIDIMGERLYNADSYPKYLSREDIKVIVGGQETFVKPTAYDYLALGNDSQRLFTWLRQRISYLEYMYKKEQSEAISKNFEIRTENGRVNYYLNIECREPTYLHLSYLNGVHEYFRVSGFNEVVKVRVPQSGSDEQEIYISPPGNIKRVYETSTPKLGFREFKVSNTENLLEIDVSNSKSLTNLSVAFTEDSLIRRIDTSNCPALTGQAALIQGDKLPYLQYINTMGSGATFTFNEKGGQIETAKLEATGSFLDIKDHTDLKELTIQVTYNLDKEPEEENLNISHSGLGYNSISLDNCSNNSFVFNIQGRYRNKAASQEGSITYTQVSPTLFENFIKKYGEFSIFSNVTELTIRNSLSPTAKKQLQPNGKVKTVKELTLAMPKLKRLEVVNTQFNKIAFVEKKITDEHGNNIFVGYPGWGGIPDITKDNEGNIIYGGDSNYIAEKREGIIADKSIKELEFRGSYELSNKTEAEQLPRLGKFQFPWRVYLGHLPNIETIKFNAEEIVAKLISYDDSGENGDPYYLTKDINDKNYSSWQPVRFELILPSPPAENEITEDYSGLKMLYFSPGINKIDFTCIRQKDTNIGEYIIEQNKENDKPHPFGIPEENIYFTTITTGDPDGKYSTIIFNPFTGVDLRGYKDLAINFKNLKNITGILGMNSLSVQNIYNNFSNNIFEGFFKGCEQLQVFHSTKKQSEENSGIVPAIYNYQKWDFSSWFTKNSGEFLTNLKEFFCNCSELKDNSYLDGLINNSSDYFNISDASRFFMNCSSLEQIDVNWKNINSTLIDIEAFFTGCSKLETANIKIENIDHNKEQYITSTNFLFSGCSALQSQPRVELLTSEYPAKSHYPYMVSMRNMFAQCKALPSLDFTAVLETGENLYDFGNIQNMTQFCMGSGIQKIKFTKIVDFKNVTNFAQGFFECGNLKEIFENDNEIILNAENGTNNDLNLQQLFFKCGNLENIGTLKNADFTRVIDLSNFFNQCSSYSGKLDLSNWKFDIKEDGTPNRLVNMASAFAAMSNITEIILPKVYTSDMNNMFLGCGRLVKLDISQVIPQANIPESGEMIEGLSAFDSVFDSCIQLTTENINGYQNWNVNNCSSFKKLFYNCSKMKTIDLSKWKVFEANKVDLSGMFESCTSLTNIYGLNDLFGTFENVLNKVSGSYNPGTLAENAVVNLFSGCQNLEFGLDEGQVNLAAWARMAVNIVSMKMMFVNCLKLPNLKEVFAKGYLDVANNSIDRNQALYWGSSIETGPNIMNKTNCEFNSLSSFEQMCNGCKNLDNFDYFCSDAAMPVGYSETANYQYPTNLSSVTQSCENIKAFTFTPKRAGMHNIFHSIGSAFAGTFSLIDVTFPPADGINNLGLKISLTFKNGLGMDENNLTSVYWRTIADKFVNKSTCPLYNFSGESVPEDLSQGYFILPSTTNSWDIMQSDSSFVQELNKLGWTLSN